MVTKNLAFRLSVRDDEAMKRKLRAVGESGQRSMRRIEQSSRPANRGLQRINRTAGALNATFSVMVKRVLILVGPLALGLLVKRSLDVADNIAKTADAIGLSTDSLQKYRFAANIAGVETAAFDKALGILAKNIGELQIKTDAELNTTLENLFPVLLKNLQGITNLTEGIKLSFQALADEENALKRVTLARALFGRGGIAMNNIVREGFEEFVRMAESAEEFGIILEERLIRNAEGAVDALTILSAVVGTQLRTAMLELAPTIIDVALNLAEAAKGAHSFFQQFKAIEQLSIAGLEDRLRLAKQRRLELQSELSGTGIRGFIVGIVRSREAIEDELKTVNKSIDAFEGLIEVREKAVARVRAGGVEPTVTPLQQREIDSLRDQANRTFQAFETQSAAARQTLQGFQRDFFAATGEQIALVELSREKALAQVEKVLAKFNVSEERAAEARVNINAAADARIVKIREDTEQKLRAPGLAIFDATRTSAERYAIVLAMLVEQLEPYIETEGKLGISQDTFDRASKQATENLEKATTSTENLTDATRDFTRVITTAFEDAVLGAKSFIEILDSLEDTLLRIAFRVLVTKPFEDFLTGKLTGGGGGGADLITQIAGGIIGLFTGPTPLQLSGPFAHGGQFQVPGPGGTDSRLVAFRASPGETVTVDPKGQRAGGRGGVTIINTFNIKTPDVAGFARSQGQVVTSFARILQSAARDM